MDSIVIIEEFKELKRTIRDDIEIKMNNLVHKFKEYVAVDHSNDSKYQMIEGICTRINYGCENNRYYYYWLAPDIQFIVNNSLWRAYAIYYDDKHKLWCVYNKDKNDFAEFNEMDTDTQIKMLEQVYKILG